MKALNRFTVSLAAGFFITASALFLLVLQQQYQQHLTLTFERSEALIKDKPELPYAIYRRDSAALHTLADRLAAIPNVTGAAIHDARNTTLATAGAEGMSLPPLLAIRGDLTIADSGTVVLQDGEARESRGFWQSLTSGGALHISIPVVSATNPNRDNLSLASFSAMAQSAAGNARNVMGYAQLAVDTRAILSHGYSAALQALALMLLAALVCGVPVFLLVRKVTAPLDDLNRFAGELSSGKPIGEMNIPESREFHPVANALNQIIKDVQKHKQEADMDRKLLNRKVDESENKLLEQDDQLTRAAQEIVAAKHKLRKITFYDSLTELPNRALFQEQLQLILNADDRNGKPLALLFLNLNSFHRVNDSFGYSVGDLVLKEVARRLTQSLHPDGAAADNNASETRAEVSRTGGDEFALILDPVDKPDAAAVVAQRVIDQVSAPMQILGQDIVVSPSIGIAIAPRDAEQVDDLTRAAGVALSNVGENPKGAYCFYSDELTSKGMDHLKLEADLRKAVELNELTLVYQPQIDAVDGSIACAEALLRWTHPEHGEISPADFIPLAKKAGLIEELGRWTLLTACNQLQKFRDRGLDLPRVAINIASDQVGPELVMQVCQALEASRMTPESLELGLSEIILMEAGSEAAKSLRDIKELGVHLSLDNFGISATPLSHLSLCPLNELKIDRHIVNNCHENPRNASLVKAIVAIAEALDLRIVAEGVESKEEFNALIEAGARMLQGFLFSKPVAASELQRQLEIPWPYMSQLQQLKLSQARK